MKKANALSAVSLIIVTIGVFSYIIYNFAKKVADYNELISKYRVDHEMGD